MRSSRRIRFLATGLALAAGSFVVARAKDDAPPKAAIEVRGLGLWHDREQRLALGRLLGRERGATLDANAVEDAAFLLLSGLIEQGYAKPVLTVRLTAADGRMATVVYDRNLTALAPEGFVATRMVLEVKLGVRYRFANIEIAGLHALPVESAKEYFLGEPVLIPSGAARAYSPAHLRRALDDLASELRRRGYTSATTKAAHVAIDDATGHVDVDVEVNEGPRWEVKAVRTEDEKGAELALPELAKFVGQPWSEFWRQNALGAIRTHFYRLGHPDVTIRLRRGVSKPHDGIRDVTVTATVNPGAEVRVGHVRFEGAKRTLPQLLERRVHVASGTPLNPLAMDEARFRLTRLGVFDSVDVRYEPATGPVRDPVFNVTEGRDTEVNLLAGYGSYEQFRGGVEWKQYNLFGRAHQTRLLLLQSVKSTRGEYDYTVPELFGEAIDGSARLFGLQRREISFLRQEFGVNATLGTHLKWIGADASLGYTYQALRSLNNTLSTSGADQDKAISASFDLSLVRDRRDNPLEPHRGYRWFVQADFASKYFGGNVDYQRVQLGGSYHLPLGHGRWAHFGLTHGFVTTLGAANDADLPVNERFFPGGDNSIRGYREGQAAPIGADGRFVGAKSYLLLNTELEQALVAKWSAVVFFDALGTAARLADYPFDDRLYTVGVGVRYQTLIGPLRAEYGYNLNPRRTDPRGTLLLSVGFPF